MREHKMVTQEIKEKKSMNPTNVCWKKPVSIQPPSWSESQLDLRMSLEGLFILLGGCSL